jgi:hypothetical protein
MRRLHTAVLAALLLCTAPAFAAAYKCQSNGKTVYSDAPCPDGDAVDLKNTPGGTVSDAQVKQSTQQAAHNKAELKRLEKDRHKREAAEEKEQKKASKEQAAKRKKCASLAMKKKWAEDDAAASVGKKSDKARTKARRLAEQYALECK